MTKKAVANKEVEIVETKRSVPAELIAQAISGGANLEQLEKLLTLQERYEANEAKKAYNKAMSDFKANPPEINKDKKVGYKTEKGSVGYTHASLYNVTEKINAALSKHGLSASWTTKQNGAISVTCKITHVRGHSEETTLSAPADTSGSKNAIQAIGSTITYLERYSLLALTGLATFDQDNDGEAAGEPIECIDDKQHHQLVDMITVKGADMAKVCKAYNITELAKFPKARFDEVLKILATKKDKQ